MKPSLSRFSRLLKPSPYPVSALCIPLQPPYSLSSLIPPPTSLSRSTLLHLHKLAALVPPLETDTKGWKDLEELGGLVSVMEGVRVGAKSREGEGMVDARVREVEKQILLEEEAQAGLGAEEEGGREFGKELLKRAKVTQGAFFVVRTPEGIRGKVRKNRKEFVEDVK